MLRFVDFFSTRESSTWSIVDRLFDSDDLVRFVDTTFPSSKPNYTLISNGRKDGSVGFSTLDCEACDCSIFLFHLVRASHARVDIFSSHSLLSTDPLVGRIDDVGSRDSSFSFASFVDWIRGVGISIGSSLDGGCTGDVHPYRVRLGGTVSRWGSTDGTGKSRDGGHDRTIPSSQFQTNSAIFLTSSVVFETLVVIARLTSRFRIQEV